MKTNFYYIIELQYLGFRYHGWQLQPDVLTVQEQMNKTFKWILPDNPCKVLAAGRTDKMVSVHQTYIELFTENKIYQLDVLLEELNLNLPADIKALSIVETDATFNIIQSPKIKEYHYYFSFGEKFHPFCAAFMSYIPENLDINLMKKAVSHFVGEHDFFSYTFRPKPETDTIMEILSCDIEENKNFTASFFPTKSYVLKIKGRGFKRNQIRLMMGMLFELGAKIKTEDEFLETIDGSNRITLSNIAPASGLQLFNIQII